MHDKITAVEEMIDESMMNVMWFHACLIVQQREALMGHISIVGMIDESCDCRRLVCRKTLKIGEYRIQMHWICYANLQNSWTRKKKKGFEKWSHDACK